MIDLAGDQRGIWAECSLVMITCHFLGLVSLLKWLRDSARMAVDRTDGSGCSPAPSSEAVDSHTAGCGGRVPPVLSARGRVLLCVEYSFQKGRRSPVAGDVLQGDLL